MCMLSHFSHVSFSATLWIVACQAPLSMGFSRHDYWSRLLCPLPRDLPEPGIEPAFLVSHALAGRFFMTSATWEAQAYNVAYNLLMCLCSHWTNFLGAGIVFFILCSQNGSRCVRMKSVIVISGSLGIRSYCSWVPCFSFTWNCLCSKLKITNPEMSGQEL